jgi:voltage-gated potassium channel
MVEPMSNDLAPESLDRHVLILNVNQKVRRIVQEIRAGSASEQPDIVVMVQDRELWQAHPDWHPDHDGPGRVLEIEGCPAEPGDLDKARVDRASAAIILADPRRGQLADAHSTLVAVAIERRSPQVHTIIELISSVNRIHLRATEVNEVICLGEITERLIAQCCISPGIQRIFRSLLAARAGTGQVFLTELPEALHGLTYREVVRRLIEAGQPMVVCGFSCHGACGPSSPGLPPAKAVVVLNPRAGLSPGKDTVLGVGDRLVVIAYKRPDLP